MTGDYSDIATDAQIRQAIEQKDDPDHEDAYTVDAVREALADVQQDLSDAIERFDDFSDVVYEDKEIIIYVDENNRELPSSLEATGYNDEILEDILSVIMHAVAREHCDYDWSAVWPLVVRKPLALRRGERHTLNRIGHLSRDHGNLPTGVDLYATQVRGWGQRKWSEYTGRSHAAAGKNVRDARR